MVRDIQGLMERFEERLPRCLIADALCIKYVPHGLLLSTVMAVHDLNDKPLASEGTSALHQVICIVSCRNRTSPLCTPMVLRNRITERNTLTSADVKDQKLKIASCAAQIPS